MERTAFRGVIYETEQTEALDGGKLHRYIVAGVLLSDCPIEGMGGNTEVIIDGHGACVLAACHILPKFQPACRLGTVDSALLQLGDDDILGEPIKRELP